MMPLPLAYVDRQRHASTAKPAGQLQCVRGLSSAFQVQRSAQLCLYCELPSVRSDEWRCTMSDAPPQIDGAREPRTLESRRWWNHD